MPCHNEKYDLYQQLLLICALIIVWGDLYLIRTNICVHFNIPILEFNTKEDIHDFNMIVLSLDQEFKIPNNKLIPIIFCENK